MANQLLGVTSDSEINEMARLFSDFVDGCLSLPINLPGTAYHTAMKVKQISYLLNFFLIYIDCEVCCLHELEWLFEYDFVKTQSQTKKKKKRNVNYYKFNDWKPVYIHPLWGHPMCVS